MAKSIKRIFAFGILLCSLISGCTQLDDIYIHDSGIDVAPSKNASNDVFLTFSEDEHSIEPIKSALDLYSSFMNNETAAYIYWLEKEVNIQDLFYFAPFNYPHDDSKYQYCIMDMGDDGIPELLIRKHDKANITIFTCTDNELTLWWSDLFWTGNSEVYCNGDIFHVRPGGVPLHYDYHYVVFDNKGIEQEHIRFSEYDMDNDGTIDSYFYENEDGLSYEEWSELIKHYTIQDIVNWKEYTCKVSLIENDIQYS